MTHGFLSCNCGLFAEATWLQHRWTRLKVCEQALATDANTSFLGGLYTKLAALRLGFQLVDLWYDIRTVPLSWGCILAFTNLVTERDGKQLQSKGGGGCKGWWVSHGGSTRNHQGRHRCTGTHNSMNCVLTVASSPGLGLHGDEACINHASVNWNYVHHFTIQILDQLLATMMSTIVRYTEPNICIFMSHIIYYVHANNAGKRDASTVS